MTFSFLRAGQKLLAAVLAVAVLGPALPTPAARAAAAPEPDRVLILVAENLAGEDFVETYARDIQKTFARTAADILPVPATARTDEIARAIETRYRTARTVGVVLIGGIPIPEVYADLQPGGEPGSVILPGEGRPFAGMALDLTKDPPEEIPVRGAFPDGFDNDGDCWERPFDLRDSNGDGTACGSGDQNVDEGTATSRHFPSIAPYTDFDDPAFIWQPYVLGDQPVPPFFSPAIVRRPDFPEIVDTIGGTLGGRWEENPAAVDPARIRPELWHGMIQFDTVAEYREFFRKNHEYHEDGTIDGVGFDRQMFHADFAREKSAIQSSGFSAYSRGFAGVASGQGSELAGLMFEKWGRGLLDAFNADRIAAIDFGADDPIAGVDNDGDGLIDEDGPERTPTASGELPEPVDDDGDGLFDEDPGTSVADNFGKNLAGWTVPGIKMREPIIEMAKSFVGALQTVFLSEVFDRFTELGRWSKTDIDPIAKLVDRKDRFAAEYARRATLALQMSTIDALAPLLEGAGPGAVTLEVQPTVRSLAEHEHYPDIYEEAPPMILPTAENRGVAVQYFSGVTPGRQPVLSQPFFFPFWNSFTANLRYQVRSMGGHEPLENFVKSLVTKWENYNDYAFAAYESHRRGETLPMIDLRPCECSLGACEDPEEEPEDPAAARQEAYKNFVAAGGGSIKFGRLRSHLIFDDESDLAEVAPAEIRGTYPNLSDAELLEGGFLRLDCDETIAVRNFTAAPLPGSGASQDPFSAPLAAAAAFDTLYPEVIERVFDEKHFAELAEVARWWGLSIEEKHKDILKWGLSPGCFPLSDEEAAEDEPREIPTECLGVQPESYELAVVVADSDDPDKFSLDFDTDPDGLRTTSVGQTDEIVDPIPWYEEVGTAVSGFVDQVRGMFGGHAAAPDGFRLWSALDAAERADLAGCWDTPGLPRCDALAADFGGQIVSWQSYNPIARSASRSCPSDPSLPACENIFVRGASAGASGDSWTVDRVRGSTPAPAPAEVVVTAGDFFSQKSSALVNIFAGGPFGDPDNSGNFPRAALAGRGQVAVASIAPPSGASSDERFFGGMAAALRDADFGSARVDQKFFAGIAAGQAVGEAVAPFSSPTTVVWGDPTIRLAPPPDPATLIPWNFLTDEAPALSETFFDKTPGEQIAGFDGQIREIARADGDGDGAEDIFATVGREVFFLKNTPTAHPPFARPRLVLTLPEAAGGVAIGEMTGDDRADAIAWVRDQSPSGKSFFVFSDLADGAERVQARLDLTPREPGEITPLPGGGGFILVDAGEKILRFRPGAGGAWTGEEIYQRSTAPFPPEQDFAFVDYAGMPENDPDDPRDDAYFVGAEVVSGSGTDARRFSSRSSFEEILSVIAPEVDFLDLREKVRSGEITTDDGRTEAERLFLTALGESEAERARTLWDEVLPPANEMATDPVADEIIRETGENFARARPDDDLLDYFEDFALEVFSEIFPTGLPPRRTFVKMDLGDDPAAALDGEHPGIFIRPGISALALQKLQIAIGAVQDFRDEDARIRARLALELWHAEVFPEGPTLDSLENDPALQDSLIRGEDEEKRYFVEFLRYVADQEASGVSPGSMLFTVEPRREETAVKMLHAGYFSDAFGTQFSRLENLKKDPTFGVRSGGSSSTTLPIIAELQELAQTGGTQAFAFFYNGSRASALATVSPGPSISVQITAISGASAAERSALETQLVGILSRPSSATTTGGFSFADPRVAAVAAGSSDREEFEIFENGSPVRVALTSAEMNPYSVPVAGVGEPETALGLEIIPDLQTMNSCGDVEVTDEGNFEVGCEITVKNTGSEPIPRLAVAPAPVRAGAIIFGSLDGGEGTRVERLATANPPGRVVLADDDHDDSFDPGETATVSYRIRLFSMPRLAVSSGDFSIDRDGDTVIDLPADGVRDLFIVDEMAGERFFLLGPDFRTRVDFETPETASSPGVDVVDEDGDGLPSWWENRYGTSPLDPDSASGPVPTSTPAGDSCPAGVLPPGSTPVCGGSSLRDIACVGPQNGCDGAAAAPTGGGSPPPESTPGSATPSDETLGLSWVCEPGPVDPEGVTSVLTEKWCMRGPNDVSDEGNSPPVIECIEISQKNCGDLGLACSAEARECVLDSAPLCAGARPGDRIYDDFEDNDCDGLRNYEQFVSGYRPEVPRESVFNPTDETTAAIPGVARVAAAGDGATAGPDDCSRNEWGQLLHPEACPSGSFLTGDVPLGSFELAIPVDGILAPIDAILDQMLEKLSCQGGCLPTPINIAMGTRFPIPDSLIMTLAGGGIFPPKCLPPPAGVGFPGCLALPAWSLLTTTTGNVCAGIYATNFGPGIIVPDTVLSSGGILGALGVCDAVQGAVNSVVSTAQTFVDGVVNTVRAALGSLGAEQTSTSSTLAGGVTQTFQLGKPKDPKDAIKEIKNFLTGGFLAGFPEVITRWVDEEIALLKQSLKFPRLIIKYPRFVDDLGSAMSLSAEAGTEAAGEEVRDLDAVFGFVKDMPLIHFREKTVRFRFPTLPDDVLAGLRQELCDWQNDAVVEIYEKWSVQIPLRLLPGDDSACRFALAQGEPAQFAWDEATMGGSCKIFEHGELAPGARDCVGEALLEKLELVVEIRGLFHSIEQNLDAIQEYADLPYKLLEYKNAKAKYLGEIAKLVRTISDLTGGWIARNIERAKGWVRLLRIVEALLENWNLLIDVFIGYGQSCEKCKNYRFSPIMILLKIFGGLIPSPPHIYFPRLPDIVLDFSTFDLGVAIEWPNLELDPYELSFPKLPRLFLPSGDLPNLRLALKLPSIPVLPLPPDLPDLPDIGLGFSLSLPDIPPAPTIPDLLPSLKAFIEALEKLFQILCFLYENIFVPFTFPPFFASSTIPTSVDGMQCEVLTEKPLFPLLDIDLGFGALFTFPDIDLGFVDRIEMLGALRLGFTIPLAAPVESLADQVNSLVGDFTDGVEKKLQDAVPLTLPATGDADLSFRSDNPFAAPLLATQKIRKKLDLALLDRAKVDPTAPSVILAEPVDRVAPEAAPAPPSAQKMILAALGGSAARSPDLAPGRAFLAGELPELADLLDERAAALAAAPELPAARFASAGGVFQSVLDRLAEVVTAGRAPVPAARADTTSVPAATQAVASPGLFLVHPEENLAERLISLTRLPANTQTLEFDADGDGDRDIVLALGRSIFFKRRSKVPGDPGEFFDSAPTRLRWADLAGQPAVLPPPAGVAVSGRDLAFVPRPGVAGAGPAARAWVLRGFSNFSAAEPERIDLIVPDGAPDFAAVSDAAGAAVEPGAGGSGGAELSGAGFSYSAPAAWRVPAVSPLADEIVFDLTDGEATRTGPERIFAVAGGTATARPGDRIVARSRVEISGPRAGETTTVEPGNIWTAVEAGPIEATASSRGEWIPAPDPRRAFDRDADGLPDSWEKAFFQNLDETAAGDPDADGISNLDEFIGDGDPTRDAPAPDTDGDGIFDVVEPSLGMHPARADAATDFDGDGLDPLVEWLVGTDPRAWDTDADGVSDGAELLLHRDPTRSDETSLPTGATPMLPGETIALAAGARGELRVPGVAPISVAGPVVLAVHRPEAPARLGDPIRVGLPDGMKFFDLAAVGDSAADSVPGARFAAGETPDGLRLDLRVARTSTGAWLTAAPTGPIAGIFWDENLAEDADGDGDFANDFVAEDLDPAWDADGDGDPRDDGEVFSVFAPSAGSGAAVRVRGAAGQDRIAVWRP